MKTSIPVYAISHTRAVDRRESTTALLDADGIEYELVDAVDRRELDLNDCNPSVKNAIPRKICRKLLVTEEFVVHFRATEFRCAPLLARFRRFIPPPTEN